MDFTSSTAIRLTSSSYTATDDQTFTSTGWATGGGFGNGTNDQTSVGAGTAITLATSSEVAFNAFDTSHSPIPGLVNSQIYDFQGISFANNYLYILQATSSGSGNGNVHRYDVVKKIWTSCPSLSLQYGINAYSAMKLDANFVYVKDSNETKVHRHTLANTTDAWQVFYNTGGSGTNSGGLYVDTNYIFTMPGNHGCENLKRHTVATTSGSWSQFTITPECLNGAYGLVTDANYVYVRPENVSTTYRHTLANTTDAWESYPPLPGGTVNQSGSRLAIHNNYLYVLASNRTTTYRHTLANTTDAWELFFDLPKKPVYYSDLVIDGDYLYVLDGAARTNTYRHTLANTTDAWESYPALPNLTSYSGGMAIGGNKIYVMPGNNSNALSSRILSDTSSAWSGSSVANYPVLPGTTGSNMNRKMTADANYIYVAKDTSKKIYRHTLFNTSSNWDTFTDTPNNIMYDGGAIITDNNYIYVLQGGGTGFYRHIVDSTSSAWDSYTALPVTASAGAGVAKDSNYFYVFPANASTNFYRHSITNTAGAWDSYAALPGGGGTVVDW